LQSNIFINEDWQLLVFSMFLLHHRFFIYYINRTHSPEKKEKKKRKIKMLNNDQHVLFYILPDHNNHMYNLTPRRHELTLAIKGDVMNFFERQLLKDTY